uniref:CSON012556 protein n=1 Tax=Culicoides sonorensis TaxID=179676 RepID=A0A336LL29_CULSO
MIENVTKDFEEIKLTDVTSNSVDRKCIQMLPEELLIEIFDKLDQSSRIAVSRTCTEWQRIIFTDCRFAKYNQLTLDHDVALEMDLEPVTLAMSPKRKFGVLRLGDVKFGQNLEGFWEKLAQTVQHLIIKEFCPYSIRSYFVAEIISKFKRLKTLDIENFFVDAQIIRLEKNLKKYTKPWSSVEKLIIGKYETEPENYNFFDNMMPNLKEIHFGTYPCIDEELIKKYANKIRSINISDHDRQVNLLYKMGESPDFQLNNVDLRLDSTVKYKQLIKFINSHPSLKSISIFSDSFPRQSIPKVQKLNLELASVINSFSPLKEFPEIRELHVKLSNYDSKCFFGHEIIPCPKLESLAICNFSSGDCLTCNQCMFQSFPNLKTFTSESCFESCTNIIELISKYSTKLVNLTNKYFVTENFCLNDSLLTWKEMKHLKSCCLNPVGTITEGGLSNFCDSCPSIEDLKFYGAINFSESMFNIVTSKLKRLRYFCVEQRRVVHERIPEGVSFQINKPNGRSVYCYRFL